LNTRSPLSLFSALLLAAVSLVSLALAGCGQNFYFAGRNLPPSGVLNRVLIAVQNPSAFTAGSLVFVDAYYDVRHAYNNPAKNFSISGFSGKDPVTIQNLPEEQIGAVYSDGDGSFSIVNYATESMGATLSPSKPPIAASIFMARNQQFLVAADQSLHALAVTDQTLGGTFYLNVPGVYRVSLNPSGTLAVGFIQNSNEAVSVFRLTQPQSVQYSNGPSTWPPSFVDCEPQNLPQYCAARISDPKALFDQPVKAIFSSDGQTIYVLNCGRECGGAQSGLVTVPINTSVLNPNVNGPAGIALQATAVLPIPGGATDAIQNSNTLYISGQQLQPDGLFAGFLTRVNLASGAITGPWGISDGNHTKMVFSDDNTLWIGSQLCVEGERYRQSQAGGSQHYGCLTMFNTATGSVFLDAYKGDLTGLTSVDGLHKVYVAEGGQVHIYNTTDGSERDNSNVAVTGTAYDVAYMDSGTDGDNANY
jgi:hypothetical protein